MKLDHIVILVRSLDASLQWYATLLALIGFQKTRDHVWINEDGVAIDIKQAAPEGRAYERYAPGLNHVGFTAASPGDLMRVRAGMAAKGFTVPEEQSFGADRALFFADPDGMRVEVTVYG
jgi:catechol 2,3-dioxygenase-like lactoylglutathione lyase family enzyme